MAEQKKYVSLSKLGLYDEKIKKVISDGDAATLASSKSYADGLAVNYDPAGAASTVQGKLDDEIARATAKEDEIVASLATTQGEVDALETLVGTIPVDGEGAPLAESVIKYIDKKTEGIATDTALAELQAAVDAAEEAIDAIEADYLKAADKTELSDAIGAETTRATGVESGLDTRLKAVEADYLKDADKTELQGNIDTNANAIAAVKEDVDAFFANADLTESAKDTLKELQDYIASDETAASEMLASIKQNADDIDTLEGKVDTLEGKMTTAEGKISANESAIAELQGKFGEGEGSVSDLIADAVAVEKGRAEGEEARIEAIANQGVADAASALAAAQAADSKADGINTTLGGKIDTLESASHTHANKTLLDSYKQTEADLADAVAKKHEHLNKTTLDGIDAAKVTTWDTVTSKAAQADLTAEVERAKAAEQANADAIGAFVECSESEILAMFPVA